MRRNALRLLRPCARYADKVPALLAQAQQALNFKGGEFTMWISDVPTQQINPPAIYLAANTVTAKTGSAASAHKLGVCQVINSEIGVFPTSDATTYFTELNNQNFVFDYYPDGSFRTDISVRIIEQPKHGRLVQEYPDTTNYEKYHYKYIPDVDYADFDHFVMEAKAGGITVQIYYTMSVSLPGEPTYVLDANGQKTDDLARCPKPYWKISFTIDTNGNNTLTTVDHQRQMPWGRAGAYAKSRVTNAFSRFTSSGILTR